MIIFLTWMSKIWTWRKHKNKGGKAKHTHWEHKHHICRDRELRKEIEGRESHWENCKERATLKRREEDSFTTHEVNSFVSLHKTTRISCFYFVLNVEIVVCALRDEQRYQRKRAEKKARGCGMGRKKRAQHKIQMTFLSQFSPNTCKNSLSYTVSSRNELGISSTLRYRKKCCGSSPGLFCCFSTAHVPMLSSH